MADRSLNIVMFDEESSIRVDYTQPQELHYSNNSKLEQRDNNDILVKEIGSLADKIGYLERQWSSLQENKGISEGSCQQSQVILKTIEKKIQIVVREVKKSIDKMTETFERKLKMTQSNPKANNSENYEQQYTQAIQEMQEKYNKEVNKLKEQTYTTEKEMLRRIKDIEEHYHQEIKKSNEKQKEYVQWIHHLENQIKELRKKRKMIAVTQEKSMDDSSNNSAINKSNSMIDKNNNQVVPRKKKRIFGDSSVSPSPNRSRSKSPNISNTLPVVNNSRQERNSSQCASISARSSSQQFVSESSVQDQSVTTQTITSNNADRSQESDMRQGMNFQKKHSTGVSPTDFYKDIPKVKNSWDRYEDFRDEEASSNSEEDVFFYPEGENHGTKPGFVVENPQQYNQQQQQYHEKYKVSPIEQKQTNNQYHVNQEENSHNKFYSPFDLNS